MVYVQNAIDSDSIAKITNFEPKIQKGDLLEINIVAVDVEASLPFNLFDTPSVGVSAASTNSKLLPYLVDVHGNIEMPVIGLVQVEGKTSNELKEVLKEKLKPYLKNPVINIRFKNFKVTVLGEVKTPGSFIVENERITVLEAVGLAGDLTIQGDRKSVTLIRETLGKRKLITLDLTDKNIFNSPYFYLAQNDVLYIAPNKTKMNSSAVGANTSILVSSISTLISLIAILTR
jgi:polysaccharide export outer membrane protein